MGGAVFPPCYLPGQIMMEVMKIMVTSLKRSHACTATLSIPNPAADHHWPLPSSVTPGHPQASLGQSLVGSLLLSPGSWCTKLLCPPRVYFPVWCKFCQLYGEVNDDLLQEGLCHTHVCCTQSPCSCVNPLLTSTGDTQTQFCLSLCGVSGSWCAQVLFEPSEPLWWEWDLILNMNLPLLPSFWASLCLWMWYIFSKMLQCCTAAAPVPTILLGILYPWSLRGLSDIRSSPYRLQSAGSVVLHLELEVCSVCLLLNV